MRLHLGVAVFGLLSCRALNHALGGQRLRLPDYHGCLDIDDDRVLDIDQLIRRVGEEGLAAVRSRPARHRSEGDTNFGVTSVAAPKAASSRTARYSSSARPAVSGGSPLSPSIPF